MSDARTQADPGEAEPVSHGVGFLLNERIAEINRFDARQITAEARGYRVPR